MAFKKLPVDGYGIQCFLTPLRAAVVRPLIGYSAGQGFDCFHVPVACPAVYDVVQQYYYFFAPPLETGYRKAALFQHGKKPLPCFLYRADLCLLGVGHFSLLIKCSHGPGVTLPPDGTRRLGIFKMEAMGGA